MIITPERQNKTATLKIEFFLIFKFQIKYDDNREYNTGYS